MEKTIEKLSQYHERLLMMIENGEEIDELFKERLAYYEENITPEIYHVLTQQIKIEKEAISKIMDDVEDYLLMLNKQHKIAKKYEEKEW